MSESRESTELPMVRGVVREWHHEEGWGVLDSPETPGGCWVLYAMIDMPRPVSVDVGQEAWFSYEEGPQDGFDWRAIRVRPAGTPSGPVIEPSPPSAAYRSWLTLSFDARPEADS